MREDHLIHRLRRFAQIILGKKSYSYDILGVEITN